MATINNENGLFHILSQCGILLQPHLRSLLTRLGFNNAPALSKLDVNKIETLEKTIRKTFASKNAFLKLKN